MIFLHLLYSYNVCFIKVLARFIDHVIIDFDYRKIIINYKLFNYDYNFFNTDYKTIFKKIAQ